MEEKREGQRFPANAYKVLGPGETYRPFVPASSVIPEITVRSAALLAGFPGILVIIPLRRYFVKEQHGLLPFP